MKYCPKCGESNPDDAKFCGKCGNTFTEITTTSGTTQGSNTSYPVVSSGMKTGIIILSIFIPLVGIIMGIIYMNDPNPSKKEVGRTWLYVGIGVTVASCLIYALLMGAGGY